MAGGIVDEEETERRRQRLLKAYCGAGAGGVVPHTVYDPRCGRCVQRFWDLYHKDDFVGTKSFLLYQATSQGLIADKNKLINELRVDLHDRQRKLDASVNDAMASRTRALEAEAKLADAERELQRLRDTVRVMHSKSSFKDDKIVFDMGQAKGLGTFHHWYDEWIAGGASLGPRPTLHMAEPAKPLPVFEWKNESSSDPIADIQEYIRKLGSTS